MNITDFNELNEIEQDEELTNHGRFILNYVLDDIVCDVYKVSEFYVKCCYNLNTNERAVITASMGIDARQLYEGRKFPYNWN